jgi:opacity protein-like surface antigen
LLLAGVASLFAYNANAVELTPYAGVDYNYSFVDHDSSMDGIMADHANSGTVVLGSKVTPYAGVEAFYDLSKKEHKSSNRSQIQSYGADILGYLPLGCYGEFELVGAAGAGWYDAKYNKDNDAGWGYRLGAGVQYNVTENWAVRAMYHHVWVDKSVLNDLNTLSLGVRYSF